MRFRSINVIYNRINTRWFPDHRFIPIREGSAFSFPFFPDKIFQVLSSKSSKSARKPRFLPVPWGLASLDPDTSRTTTIFNSFIRIFALKKKRKERKSKPRPNLYVFKDIRFTRRIIDMHDTPSSSSMYSFSKNHEFYSDFIAAGSGFNDPTCLEVGRKRRRDKSSDATASEWRDIFRKNARFACEGLDRGDRSYSMVGSFVAMHENEQLMRSRPSMLSFRVFFLSFLLFFSSLRKQGNTYISLDTYASYWNSF